MDRLGQPWIALLGAIAGSVAACSGQVVPSGEHASVDGGPGVFVDTPGTDAGASSFRVTAFADAPSICKGQCVDLVAQGHGGEAPYAYSWDQALSNPVGARRVCPSSTTTYTVVSHDSSGMSGELGHAAAQASASVTVTIGPSCADAGTLADDAGPIDDAGAPPPPVDAGPAPPVTTTDRELCGLDFFQPPQLYVGPMQLVTGSDGSIFIAFDYFNELWGESNPGPDPVLNVGTTPPQVFPGGIAVVKLDDGCHVLWAREFGAADGPFNGIGSVQMRIDAANEITILGAFVGSIDLGKGTVSAPSSVQDGFLMRLDTNGKTVFATPFKTQKVDAMTVYDVAVTPSGISTVALFAGTDTDYGGSGPDYSNFFLGQAFYVAQFDAKGALVYRKPVVTVASNANELLQLTTNASGALWATGWTVGTASNSNGVPLVMGLSSAGVQTWLRTNDVGTPLIAAGPHGAVGLEASNTAGPIAGQLVSSYQADGTSPWSNTVTETASQPSGQLYTSQLVLDGNGNAVAGGVFGDNVGGSVTSEATATMTSAGGHDLYFQAFDGAGRLRTQGRYGGPDDETFGGVSVDPTGNVVLGGYTNPLVTASTSSVERVFVVKLTPP